MRAGGATRRVRPIPAEHRKNAQNGSCREQRTATRLPVEGDFRTGDRVQVRGGDGTVYVVKETRTDGTYTLQHTTEDTTQEGLRDEDLENWEPEFTDLDDVYILPDYERALVTGVNDDGTYEVCRAGGTTTTTAHEFDLVEYTPLFTELVKVSGSRDIWKVVRFEKGTYTLKNTADESETRDADIANVLEFEGSEFDVQEWVILENGTVRQVASFNDADGTYKLKNEGRAVYRQSQLQPAPPPTFGRYSETQDKYIPDKDQYVTMGDGRELHTIKKINREDQTYTLDDGRTVSENDLKEYTEVPRFGQFSESQGIFIPDKNQQVVVKSESEPRKITKVLRKARAYVLDDGRTVSENDLKEYINESMVDDDTDDE